MGCYGIGINRIVAGAVEAGHDANGIIWPLAVAPYQVVVVPLQVQNAAVMEVADRAGKVVQRRPGLSPDRRPRPRPWREVQGRRPDRHPIADCRGRGRLKDGKIEAKWRTSPRHSKCRRNGRDDDPGELAAARQRHEA